MLNSKNSKIFLNPDKGGFSSGEATTLLNDKRLDDEKIQEVVLQGRTVKDKFTRLKFFLIGKKIIIAKIFGAIKIKEFVTVNELSNILEQEVRLTMKKGKAPFSQFLKDFLEDEGITKGSLEFYKRKKFNGKEENSVITLPKEELKKLKKIKQKEEREQARLEALEAKEKELIKSYEIKYDCEIVIEEKTIKKVETMQDLEKQLEDENLSIKQRAKIMQKIHILEEALD